MGSPQFQSRDARHTMAQRTNFPAGDGDFAHVEELDVRYRAAVELAQYLRSIGALDLISVESTNDRHIADDRSFISGECDVIPSGFGVVLHPVVNRGPADEQQTILREMKEDGVADDVSVVVASNELLGLVDGEIRKRVDTSRRQQLEGVGAINKHVGHVVGLVK